MAILQSQDLFVVYQPETGSPQVLTTSGIDSTLVSNNTGEIYEVSCNRLNATLVGDEEQNHISTGVDVKMSIKILDGEPVDLYLVSGGQGYVIDELLELEGGTTKIRVTSVGEGGEVLGASIYDVTNDYVITDGLLTNFPFGTVTDMESYEISNIGSFIDLKVEDGVVTAASKGQQHFDHGYVQTPTTMTVGDTVRILLGRIASGQYADVTVKMVTNVVSGGVGKFNVGQLKSDVQEWASENDVNLDVEVVENSGEPGGNLSYDSVTGKITFTKGASTLNSDEESVDLTQSYGFVLDSENTWDPATSSAITTQKQLNDNLLKRIELLESTLYASTDETKINFESPQLTNNTLAKDINGDTYSSVATRNDVSQALAADAKATTALTESNNIFESIVNSSNFDELKPAVIASEASPTQDNPDPDDDVPVGPDPNDPNYNG